MEHQLNQRLLYFFWIFTFVPPLILWITILLRPVIGEDNLFLSRFGILLYLFTSPILTLFISSYCYWLLRKTKEKIYWKYSWIIFPWSFILDAVFFYQSIVLLALMRKWGFDHKKISSINQNLFIYQGLTNFAIFSGLTAVFSILASTAPFEMWGDLPVIWFVCLYFIFVKMIINQIIDLVVLKEQLALKTYAKVGLVCATFLCQFWLAIILKKKTFVQINQVQNQQYLPSWRKKE